MPHKQILILSILFLHNLLKIYTMAFCPADCEDITLDQNPDNCDLPIRQDGLERLMFFTCDTDLPTPLTCGALETLYNAGKISFSSPIAQGDLADPTYASISVSDCVPALEVVSGRVISGRDYVAIDKAAVVVSPMEAAQPYYNQVFWADKLTKQASIRYAFIKCSGRIVIGVDENGNYAQATLRAFLKQENMGTAESPKMIEYIQWQITFNTDPVALANLPEENNDNTNFDISACDLY